MIVQYFSPASGRSDVTAAGTQRGQVSSQNSLLYHQHVDPQKTNSTAKGFSENLQPLYAVSTRGKKQVSKKKTDQDSASLCHPASDALA